MIDPSNPNNLGKAIVGSVPQIEGDSEMQEKLQSIINLHLKTPSLESQENVPLFHLFTLEGVLPGDFALKRGQEQLIKDLFAKRSLDSSICLMDLVGLEIYDSISNILGAKDSEIVNEFRKEFSSLLFLAYLGFLRVNQTTRSEESVMNRFYGFPDNPRFMNRLSKVMPKIKDAVLSKQYEIRNHKILSSDTKNKLIQGLNDKVNRLQSYFDLFLDLFGSPYAHTILLSNSLSCFSGAMELENSKKSLLEDLQKYMSYIKNLFSAAEDMGYTGLRISPIFDQISTYISSLKSMRIEDIVKFQKKILDGVTIANYAGDESRENHKLALEGKLTHKQWKEQNKIKSSTGKEPGDFIEQMFQDFLTSRLILCFLQDIERITEYQFFSERFSGDFLPNDLLKNRVVVNEWIIAQASLSETREDSNPRSFLSCAVRREIRAIFEPLLAEVKENSFIRSMSTVDLEIGEKVTPTDLTTPPRLDTSAMSSSFDHSFLGSFQSHIEALNDLNKELPTIRQRLVEQLQKILSQESSTYTLENIKDLVFQEMLPFFPVVILLKDIEKLQGEVISPLISEELASLLTLEGLILPKPQEEGSSAHLSTADVESLLEQTFKEDTPTLAYPAGISSGEQSDNNQFDAFIGKREERSIDQELKKKNSSEGIAPKLEEKISSQASLSLKSSSEERDEEFELGSRNVHEIMAKLRKHGFIEVRQKGSHHVYKIQDPVTKQGIGPQVIVPGAKGEEVARGTLKSIEAQAQVALSDQGAKKIDQGKGPKKKKA